MTSIRQSLLRPSLHWLLVFLPITVWAEYCARISTASFSFRLAWQSFHLLDCWGKQRNISRRVPGRAWEAFSTRRSETRRSSSSPSSHSRPVKSTW